MAGIFQNGIFHFSPTFLANTSPAFLAAGLLTTHGNASTTNARYGDGQTLQITGTGDNGFSLGVNLARLIQGIYILDPVLPSSGWVTLIYWSDVSAGAVQLRLMLHASGMLQFYLANGTTPVGPNSAPGTIQAGRGAYIQTDFTINSSTGIVKLYVDTSGTAAIISATGVNSQSTANAWVNQCWWSDAGVGTGVYYQDFYILDLTGSAPFNAILGPVHQHDDPPNSDASPNQFSTNPSQTTGNHYKNVDSPTTQIANYNFDNNPGDEELYGFPNLPATTTKVFCITEWIYSELDAAGARTVSPVLVNPLGGAPQVGAAYAPASTPSYAYEISTIDPDTSAPWASGTVAAAEGAELGLEIVT
jgi:hypothetical protein